MSSVYSDETGTAHDVVEGCTASRDAELSGTSQSEPAQVRGEWGVKGY